MAQSELKEQISFPEHTKPLGSFADPVVIIDPVYSQNNVASRITENERKQIVQAAREAWETAHFASTEDDESIWKEIFGPGFKTEDEN
jgi:tRNA nucleotidyltransferase (CCA-adding enzyme)